MDGVEEVSMAFRVSPIYAAWWIAMCPGPLGLDELESGSDGVVRPQSEEEN